MDFVKDTHIHPQRERYPQREREREDRAVAHDYWIFSTAHVSLLVHMPSVIVISVSHAEDSCQPLSENSVWYSGQTTSSIDCKQIMTWRIQWQYLRYGNNYSWLTLLKK